jgi:hypothetical protein
VQAVNINSASTEWSIIHRDASASDERPGSFVSLRARPR